MNRSNVRVTKAVKREVKEGLTTETYSFRATPSGGVQTSRKTGAKIIYKWGGDGILRPTETVPAPHKRKVSRPRLTKSR